MSFFMSKRQVFYPILKPNRTDWNKSAKGMLFYLQLKNFSQYKPIPWNENRIFPILSLFYQCRVLHSGSHQISVIVVASSLGWYMPWFLNISKKFMNGYTYSPHCVHFSSLKKCVTQKSVNGTVLKIQLTQNSPTNIYISQKPGKLWKSCNAGTRCTTCFIIFFICPP